MPVMMLMSGVPALQVKGEAEAFAIEAKARAEAEQMAKKADAWKDYQDAAMVDMVLETLPKVKLSCRLFLVHSASFFPNPHPTFYLC